MRKQKIARRKPKNYMYWADKFAKEIIDSGQHRPYWVDDMKTPSGRVHIGSVRAVVTHYLIYRALVDRGVDATFSYVFEDHDPLDKLPFYIDEKEFGQHVGKPLFQIPSPEEGYDSYGARWSQEYKEIFNSIGVNPKIILGSELYLSGKMNDSVKQCLDKADEIRKIYQEFYGEDVKPEGWIPFNVVCEECGKLMSTVVDVWDGESVIYSCQKDVFDGCGYSGKTSPFSGKDRYAGKLPWKIEWACKWKAIGVTVEGAGKDHMTEGGSHDVSSEVCKRVIDYPVPFHFSHEFFLVGGRKMSSSKGTGSSAKEVAEIIPPYLVRFMIVRVRYNRAINFDPSGDTIPDLFDAYDEAARNYWSKGDKRLSRIFELSQVSDEVSEEHFLPRFREVAKFLQYPKLKLEKEVERLKGSKLTKHEQEVLDERIKYARIWLDGYAPEDRVFQVKDELPKEVASLNDLQKEYLGKVVELLDLKWKSPDELQQALYDATKELGLGAKDAFGAIYLSLLGKTHGPKAAWFLLEQDKDIVASRLQASIEHKNEKKEVEYKFDVIDEPDLVSIDTSISEAYPDMKVAMAIIEGVDNRKYTKAFEKYRDDLVAGFEGITVEDIGENKKIRSYRRAIRESGIDWHKRRPTMEALLRRVAQGKELYWINPLVDIGNLMAMKHHASQGVFDLDKVKFPALMRKSAGGEKVLMLGDKEPITLKEGEICYFDQEGPFIVDLCWRDAQRTGADEKTKNVMFLSEAMYDITRKDLEEVLEDLIKTVTTYLGGKVMKKGILLASEVK